MFSWEDEHYERLLVTLNVNKPHSSIIDKVVWCDGSSDNQFSVSYFVQKCNQS